MFIELIIEKWNSAFNKANGSPFNVKINDNQSRLGAACQY
ncbi:MAG: hypothetical protein ACJAT8_001340 [Cellvibrionaceae bacterium]|jgi:hypothetical protein